MTNTLTYPLDLSFNLERALSQMGDDFELFDELAGLFLSDCPLDMHALDDAIESGDSPLIRHHAHRIKGMCAAFGLNGMVDLAARIEYQNGLNLAQEMGSFRPALETIMRDIKLALSEKR